MPTIRYVLGTYLHMVIVYWCFFYSTSYIICIFFGWTSLSLGLILEWVRAKQYDINQHNWYELFIIKVGWTGLTRKEFRRSMSAVEIIRNGFMSFGGIERSTTVTCETTAKKYIVSMTMVCWNIWCFSIRYNTNKITIWHPVPSQLNINECRIDPFSKALHSQTI